MDGLKFADCKTFLMILLLCIFLNYLETKTINTKKQPTRLDRVAKLRPSAKLPNKRINDFKDKGPPTKGTGGIFGDILCELCRKLKDSKCILRYCTGANMNGNKVLANKIDKIKIDMTTVIDALGDMLCQLCKNTKNKTCKARFCSRRQPKCKVPNIATRG